MEFLLPVAKIPQCDLVHHGQFESRWSRCRLSNLQVGSLQWLERSGYLAATDLEPPCQLLGARKMPLYKGFW